MKKVRNRLNKGISPWDIKLLYEAVGEITKSNIFNPWEAKTFADGWTSALNLHRDCFHDFMLPQPLIKNDLENVKGMVTIARNLLKRIETTILSSGTVNDY